MDWQPKGPSTEYTASSGNWKAKVYTDYFSPPTRPQLWTAQASNNAQIIMQSSFRSADDAKTWIEDKIEEARVHGT
jgi:hypothetical protein